MSFGVVGFTLRATAKAENEDRVLVHDRVLATGRHQRTGLDRCYAFVADGIGGSRQAALASGFLLDALRDRLPETPIEDAEALRSLLAAINEALIGQAAAAAETAGSATTLVGAVLWPGGLHLINAGDSEAWLWREGRFFRLFDAQVLDPRQPGSPVTSYFGGVRAALTLEFGSVLREFRAADVLLLCSDGLMKVIPADQINDVLRNDRPVEEQVAFLAARVAAAHRPDDVSCLAVTVQVDDDEPPGAPLDR